MIKAIFFDYGGVLVNKALNVIYNDIPGKDKTRLKSLFYEVDLLTGSSGTLSRLLRDKYSDLDLTTEEIVSFFRYLPRINEVWDIARRLRKEGSIVGIISDQFAELAEVRKQDHDFITMFDPILFSCEVKLTKFDTRIFSKAEEITSHQGRELVMIDDNKYPLDVASSLDWNCVLFTDPKSLEKN